MKHGVKAMMKMGMTPAAIQIGPKGGRFYITSGGQKKYGEPPSGAEHSGSSYAEEHARKPVAKVSTPHPIPPHLKKGDPTWVYLKGEGWVKGKVSKIDAKKGQVTIVDKHGTIKADFYETSPTKGTAAPKKPKKEAPPAPPEKKSPVKFKTGDFVRVEVEDGEWMRGRILETRKDHHLVELADGDHAEAKFNEVRPTSTKRQISEFLTKAPGTRHESTVHITMDAIEDMGAEAYMKRRPIAALEDETNSSYYGTYWKTMQKVQLRAQVNYEDEHALQSGRNMPDKFTTNEHSTTTFETRKSAYHGAKATAIHELSHHLHLDGLANGYLPTELDYRMQRVADKARRKLTKYADTNHKEWWSEAHTMYVLNHKRLLEMHEESYYMVREVRAALGLKDDV